MWQDLLVKHKYRGCHLIGKIKQFNRKGNYGFIIDESGIDRFFHGSNLQGNTIPQIDDPVTFEPILLPKGPGATEIRIVVTTGDSFLLEEIAQWKSEAKLENNNRYFYQTSYIKLITNGSRCYVLGRKGTGKTAICEYLSNIKSSKVFSKKLTFKNYPFNDLYSLSNDRYTQPNQYITLWKYLIYSIIAQLMTKNEGINSELRQKLETIYSEDIAFNLDQKVRKWTSDKFKFSLFGAGFEIHKGNDTGIKTPSWIDKVEALEAVILGNIDNSTYYVLFDELDEDYKDFSSTGSHNDYFSLLTSLFKAIQDVKSIMNSRGCKIYPILFLRSDIFKRVIDPDKTKWSDISIELEWNRALIKKMLAYRLSRALSEKGAIKPFDEVWLRVFRPEFIQFKYGQKEVSIFEFIMRNSHHRPRDFIHYIRDCAEGAVERDYKVIDSGLVRILEKKFSSYLRSEIVDELSSVLPQVNHVFNVLSALGKMHFNSNDFASTYNNYCEDRNIECKDYKSVLEILFSSSAIGNINREGKKSFCHIDSDATCAFETPFCVHRGLLKSLQIL
jgi:cold shock CspA family protein